MSDMFKLLLALSTYEWSSYILPLLFYSTLWALSPTCANADREIVMDICCI